MSVASDELIARLKECCRGQPAQIPWPHRVLHDAIAAIEAADEALAARDREVENLKSFIKGMANNMLVMLKE